MTHMIDLLLILPFNDNSEKIAALTILLATKIYKVWQTIKYL